MKIVQTAAALKIHFIQCGDMMTKVQLPIVLPVLQMEK